MSLLKIVRGETTFRRVNSALAGRSKTEAKLISNSTGMSIARIIVPLATLTPSRPCRAAVLPELPIIRRAGNEGGTFCAFVEPMFLRQHLIYEEGD
jgi:hypothetical protein